MICLHSCLSVSIELFKFQPLKTKLSTTLIALDGTACDCSELTPKSECQKASYCSWSDESSVCQKILYDCQQHNNSKENCDSIVYCAWTNSETCDLFTQCSDYTVTEETKEECALKNSQCVPGTVQSDGKIACQRLNLNCPGITDQKICHETGISDLVRCSWDYYANSCSEQNYEYCTKTTNVLMCNLRCAYTYQGCQPPSCSKHKNDTDCTYVRKDSIYETHLCIWQNGSCQDAKDASHLNASACFSKTYGTFTWRQNSCVPCQGTFYNGTSDSNNNTNNNTSTSTGNSSSTSNSTDSSSNNTNGNNTENGNSTNNNNNTNNNTGTNPTSNNGTSGNGTASISRMLLWLGLIELAQL